MEASASVINSHPLGPSLILTWHEQEIVVPADEALLFGIGSAPANELEVQGQFVSRYHAVLRWQNNSFELIDRSTNGVFVQLEDTQVRLVHRTNFRLWGSGYLSFGEPLNEDNCLSFRDA